MKFGFFQGKMNMSFIANLKLIWTMKAPKPIFLKYMLFWFGFYLLCAFLSALLFSHPYLMDAEYISFLGSPEPDRNPNGYWIYNVAVFVAGMALIPHFTYIYRSLRATMGAKQTLGDSHKKSKFCQIYAHFMDKTLPAFACFLGTLGYIGFALIGIFYQQAGGFGSAANVGHKVSTIVAFGGLGAAAVFLMFVFMRRLRFKAAWLKPWQFVVVYGLAILLVIIALTAVNSYMSEWLFLFIILYWLVMMGIFYIPAAPNTCKTDST